MVYDMRRGAGNWEINKISQQPRLFTRTKPTRRPGLKDVSGLETEKNLDPSRAIQ